MKKFLNQLFSLQQYPRLWVPYVGTLLVLTGLGFYHWHLLSIQTSMTASQIILYMAIGILCILIVTAIFAIKVVDEKIRLTHEGCNLLIRTVLHDVSNYSIILGAGISMLEKRPETAKRALAEAMQRMNTLCGGINALLLNKDALAMKQAISVEMFIEIFEKIAALHSVGIVNNVTPERRIFVDSIMMTNALFSLIKNSVAAGATKITTIFSEDNSSLSITIKDNGRGIPLDVARQLLKGQLNLTPGNGSGMLLIRLLLALNGASISISEPNSDGTKETIISITGIPFMGNTIKTPEKTSVGAVRVQ